jgi:hypothetical protein
MMYTPGQTVVMTGTFLDPVTRAGLTPTSLRLRILDPAGAETDMTSGFVNPSAGVYTFALVATTVGQWTYRWEATAPFSAACEGTFFVAKTAFASPL